MNKVDGRRFNGSKRVLTDKVCKECGIVFRPKLAVSVFCKNDCRLKNLHKDRRNKGIFFDVKCWTEEEDNLIRKLYPDPDNSLSYIAGLINRTSRGVKNRVAELKVYRSRPYDRKGSKNPFYGKKHSRETRKIISDTLKTSTAFRRLAKDPEFQRKRRQALYAKPNKMERFLDAIIQEVCPDQYDFVGDGAFIVDGLNPDWVHRDKKLIIELFGRSFHDPDECAWEVPDRSTLEGRTEALEKFGYKVLVIWDDEIRYKYKRLHLPNKIEKFTELGDI